MEADKVAYSTETWDSSSSDSGCDSIYETHYLTASNFPQNTTDAQVKDFFGDGVTFASALEEYYIETEEETGAKTRVHVNTHAIILFNSEIDAKKGLKLSAKPFSIGGPQILVRRQQSNGAILHVSGFSTLISVEEMKQVLEKSFASRGTILNIFLPLDPKTGSTLGFGYILLNTEGKDESGSYQSTIIDGVAIKVRKANLKKIFTPEIEAYDDEDEDEKKALKKALKKTLLPIRWMETIPGRTEMKSSWRTKRPGLIPESVRQAAYECWTIPLVNAYAVLMSLKGLMAQELTTEFLMGAVDPVSIISGEGIDKLKNVIKVMQPRFVKEMVIHHRPRGGNMAEHEAFEEFIIALLDEESPLMVGIEYFDSYSKFNGHGVYRPTVMESQARTFERHAYHCLFLTGNGVFEGVDHWEAQESAGPEFGDDFGFIRIARHMCLIKQVVELRI